MFQAISAGKPILWPEFTQADILQVYNPIASKPHYIYSSGGILKTKIPDFEENSFDHGFAVASLLHLSPEEMPTALKNIHSLVKSGGRVYIGLKEGEGMLLVDELDYRIKAQRKFTFWTEDTLSPLLVEAGFETTLITHEIKGATPWVNFFLRNNK